MAAPASAAPALMREYTARPARRKAPATPSSTNTICETDANMPRTTRLGLQRRGSWMDEKKNGIRSTLTCVFICATARATSARAETVRQVEGAPGPVAHTLSGCLSQSGRHRQQMWCERAAIHMKVRRLLAGEEPGVQGCMVGQGEWSQPKVGR